MRTLSCWLAIAAPLVGGPALADEAAITFTITSPGEAAEADVDCQVMQGGVVRQEVHSGRLPIDLAFDADRVTCSVASPGRIVVEARSARGNRSRAEISGGQSVVSISN
ncbi:MAG: hypothetical protein ACFCVH_11655 [Alphaproteobacteria bacterium]